MADKKSNQDRALRKNESIELVKLLEKKHLIEAIKNITIPSFNINISLLTSHEIYCDELKQNIKIDDYQIKNSLRINYNSLLYDLKLKWINSNFTLNEQDLLKSVNKELVNNYAIKKKQKIKNK